MTNVHAWLDAYERMRAHGPGHPSEWLGTPLAVAGLVGWLWSLPSPEAFRETGAALNWGTVFLMATVVYYFILSISLAFGSLPFVAALAALGAWLDRSTVPLAELACAAFVLALVWQVIESRRANVSVGVFRHAQYLMIGPLWLLAAVYRRVRIPY
jgi:hypothetical protein